jgi:chaperonin GroEL
MLLTRGVERLNRLLSLTLGPTRGRVVVTGASAAELLDDAAQLNKQALSFGDSLEDVGHQCLRSALDRLYEQTKDGIATCAVLTHAILKQTTPLLAFGHHPVPLQRDIRLAQESARDCLRRRSWTIDAPDEIAGVIRTANLPSELAEIVAEIVDAIGADGALLVEETRQTGLAREYIRGGRWGSGVASPSFLDRESTQVTVREPLILVTDHSVTAVEEAVAVLEAASGSRSLLLIAPGFSDAAVAVLLANRDKGGFESVVAVKAPQSVHSGSQQLDDIALMTGGRYLPREHASALRLVSRGDLGRAERAWASRSAFGIIGGAGESGAMRQRAADLRARARGESDPVRKAHFSARAGNLTGLSALVRVGPGVRGGPTTRQVERAAAIARAALGSGVVEGGGAALARAGQFVARGFCGSEHEVGATALASALAAPMATIIRQTGREPGPLLNCLSANGDVFDVRAGRWVNARDTGLADPLAVVEGALEVAVSTALMVLSTDVLVGRRAGR